jgi:hypothetical protein
MCRCSFDAEGQARRGGDPDRPEGGNRSADLYPTIPFVTRTLTSTAIAWATKHSSGSRLICAAAHDRNRPNAAARVRRTAPPARRSHFSRPIVPACPERTIPMATLRCSGAAGPSRVVCHACDRPIVETSFDVRTCLPARGQSVPLCAESAPLRTIAFAPDPRRTARNCLGDRALVRIEPDRRRGARSDSPRSGRPLNVPGRAVDSRS